VTVPFPPLAPPSSSLPLPSSTVSLPSPTVPPLPSSVPLAIEGLGPVGSFLLLGVIAVAGIGTGVLFLVSVVASRRRGGDQFRLISVAVGVLLARSIVGAGTVLGYVPMPVHHFLEHSLDFLIAAIVLYAVYAHAPGSLPEST